MKYIITKGDVKGTIVNGVLDKKNKRVIDLDNRGVIYSIDVLDMFIEFKSFTIECYQTHFKGLNHKDNIHIVSNDLENIVFTVNRGKKEYKLHSDYLFSWMQSYKNSI